MQRRQFVGSGLALAATLPLRGFAAGLKDIGEVPAKSLAGGEIVLPGSSVEAFAASLRAGYSYSGKSSCDGGLMIDLQPMQGVRVDPETKRA